MTETHQGLWHVFEFAIMMGFPTHKATARFTAPPPRLTLRWIDVKLQPQ